MSCGCGGIGSRERSAPLPQASTGTRPDVAGILHRAARGRVVLGQATFAIAVKCTSHLRASCPVTRREHCRAAYVRHLTRAHRESGSGGHAEPHHRARLTRATGSIRRSQRVRTRRNCDAARCRTAALAGIQNSRRRQHRYRNGRLAIASVRGPETPPLPRQSGSCRARSRHRDYLNFVQLRRLAAYAGGACFPRVAQLREDVREAPCRTQSGSFGTGSTPRPAGSSSGERSSLPIAAQASVVAKTFA